MKNNLLKNELNVINNKISVIEISGVNYISLTDLARYANKEEPKIPIQTWMRNKDVISYLGLWEQINNENFKGIEFATFENMSGRNSFYISPQRWIKSTNAIGIISKSGNNGGTFAHPDIAFEFASWLSPEFKLYLIKEFERLKEKEAFEYKIEWKASRLLSKVNYAIHTDAIKENIVPKLTEEQKQFIYEEEADILNVALFGMTAKEFKNQNPLLSGNIRDYADLLHLVILSNLENINAELVKQNISQKDRLINLNDIARKQMKILRNNRSIQELKIFQNEINNPTYLK